MRKALAATVLASTLVLAGCTATDTQSAPSASPSASATADAAAVEQVLAGYGVTGTDAVEVIDTLDRLTRDERPTNLMASVGVDQLLITAGEGQLALDIPDDKFYLSLAPYLESTHDCFYHSLTTCTGELGGADVGVRIVDDATGEVLVDGDHTTVDNGFIGFWLPRNIDATVRVTYDDKAVEAPISTGDDAPTCLTTLQLT